ncbi:MAG: hypothetical protein LBC69_01575 [Eubacteriaceae bacterium]|jgi:cytochrome c-type biogenesis protein CcmE|nr:hypothetical protein [Eubacteriaceae bacterium]
MEEEERGRKRRRLALVLCIVAAALALAIGAALLACKSKRNGYEYVPPGSRPADATQDESSWDALNFSQFFEIEQGDSLTEK